MATTKEIDDFFRKNRIDNNLKIEGQKIDIRTFIILLDDFGKEQYLKGVHETTELVLFLNSKKDNTQNKWTDLQLKVAYEDACKFANFEELKRHLLTN